MNNGGDAAEQVVRLSLEGFEVAAKLTGSAAKNVALLLVSVLKQEQQTKGKARLTNMIKSGKELKVFSIPNKDLAQFTKQAKRYGVLYCVLRDKSAKGDDVPVDIIARAEDASKIQRIVERFEIGKVDKAGVITQAEQDKADREAVAREVPTKTKGEIIVEEAMGKPLQKEGQSHENPTVAKTEKSPPSERSSEISGTQGLEQISYESCPIERIASLSCGTAQSGSSKGKSSMSFWKEHIQSNNQRCDSQNRIVVPNGGYRYPKAKRK